MKKARLIPLFFTEANERERKEFEEQIERLHEYYGDVAEILPEVKVGQPLPADADAILFPQLIFAAFRHDEELKNYGLPMIVLTSRFDGRDVGQGQTYLRDLGCTVFSPYSIEIAKALIRAIAVKSSLDPSKVSYAAGFSRRRNGKHIQTFLLVGGSKHPYHEKVSSAKSFIAAKAGMR